MLPGSFFLILCQEVFSLAKKNDKVVSKYNFYYICTMRKIIAYKHYFSEFMDKLSEQERKKTQKTPDNEIKKAINLKKEYYEAKRNK